jgi:hypothetical protein
VNNQRDVGFGQRALVPPLSDNPMPSDDGAEKMKVM